MPAVLLLAAHLGPKTFLIFTSLPALPSGPLAFQVLLTGASRAACTRKSMPAVLLLAAHLGPKHY